jgi:hypothetical protein
VPARGASSVEGAYCPAGNVLIGALPLSPALPGERLALLGDGFVAREGSPWPSPEIVSTVDGELGFDLGRLTTLRELRLQMDADQALDVALSTDGASFEHFVLAAHPTATGMISRQLELPSVEARYLRLRARDESQTLALTELGLFCQQLDSAAPAWHVAPSPKPPREPSWFASLQRGLSDSPVVTPLQTNLIKALVVVSALLWLAFGTSLKRARDAVLGALAATALAAYLNFGAYHYPTFIHEHDVFHYFVGAKYFAELGYNDLYTCAAVAEADAGFPQRVKLRAQRDLRTNRLVSGVEVLRHAAECHQRFSPQRWREFSADVAYFADARGVDDWHRVIRDHGFNASPTWIAIGRSYAKSMPATDSSIGRGDAMFAGKVGVLDPLLLLAALFSVSWAFGWRTASLIAIVFGCNPLSEFAWVGGGFLRQLWLVALVLGICLLRRRIYWLGGALLALAACLQLFPGVCLLSVALGVGIHAWRTRHFDPNARSILLGSIVAAALLVPLSSWSTGRSQAWSEFSANTSKHAATPSANLVGLPTLLSFRMSTRASQLFDPRALDPFAKILAARRQSLDNMGPARWLGAALGLLALARCLRRPKPWWWTAALGLSLVPLLLDTSCYYAAWLVPLALLSEQRKGLLSIVLGLILGALGLELWASEPDVHYALVSWLVVAGAFGILWLMGRTSAHAAAELD